MTEDLLDEMAKHSAPWLNGEGPDSAVVLSSRIRLARNISEFPFPPSASTDVREKIIDLAESAFKRIPGFETRRFLPFTGYRSDQSDVFGGTSFDFAAIHEGWDRSGLFIDPKERVSIMLNEEDHVRLQVLSSGMSLHNCWEYATKIDNDIGKSLQFEFR